MGKVKATQSIEWHSTDDNFILEMTTTEWLFDGRYRYEWIAFIGGTCICTSGNDSAVMSGISADQEPDCMEGLRAFSGFLTAWEEAMEHSERVGHDSENVELFDARMVPTLEYAQEMFMDMHSEQFEMEARL